LLSHSPYQTTPLLELQNYVVQAPGGLFLYSRQQGSSCLLYTHSAAPASQWPYGGAAKGFARILKFEEGLDGPTAFAEVYCASFLLLDQHWLRTKASYMEFNQVCLTTLSLIAWVRSAIRKLKRLRIGLISGAFTSGWTSSEMASPTQPRAFNYCRDFFSDPADCMVSYFVWCLCCAQVLGSVKKKVHTALEARPDSLQQFHSFLRL